MNHIIVTRASFDSDELLEKYLVVMNNLYIPCLARQTCKNFDVCIIVKEKHKSIVEEEFKKYNFNLIMVIGNARSYDKWVSQKHYDIQTRHDCDDWMSDDYIERIQQVYIENIKKFDTFLIQAQPVKMDYSTNIMYRMSPYSNTRTSMFLSLCQRECKKSIMQEQHGHFPKIVPDVIDLGYGYTKWVAHGNNISAKIEKSDIKIENVTIISSIFGNVEIIKSCVESWFPVPMGWEVCLYDNKVSEIDGTSEYLDELSKKYKIKIIRDGQIRSHPDAINILMDHVKTEWVLHLDSDMELLDKKFYTWAENTVGKDKTKAWGIVEKYNSSKFKKYSETENYYTLHLPRAAPYALLFNKTFYDSKNIDFGNIVIEGGKIIRGRGEIFQTSELVPEGSMIRVTGDTGWKIYWEAFRHDVFCNISGDVWGCWSHKEASSRKWMAQNSEKIKKLKI